MTGKCASSAGISLLNDLIIKTERRCNNSFFKLTGCCYNQRKKWRNPFACCWFSYW